VGEHRKYQTASIYAHHDWSEKCKHLVHFKLKSMNEVEHQFVDQMKLSARAYVPEKAALEHVDEINPRFLPLFNF